MKITTEVCCGSTVDVFAAYQNGADRVELNSALFLGGLTPSFAAVKASASLDIPVICMVRTRGGGFCYDQGEQEMMMADARLFLEENIAGLAFGFLNADGTVNEKATKRMVDLIHRFHKQAVFHRAFDVTPDPYQAMETLISLKVDRVLTSGQKPTALEGLPLLEKLREKYGDKIEILPGSGINANNAQRFIEKGFTQLHSSCKAYKSDPTSKAGVSFRYMDNDNYEVVDGHLVASFVEAVKKAE